METKMEKAKFLTAIFTGDSHPKVNEETGISTEVFVFTVGAGKEYHQKLADRLTGMLFGDTQSAPQVTIKEEDLKDL